MDRIVLINHRCFGTLFMRYGSDGLGGEQVSPKQMTADELRSAMERLREIADGCEEELADRAGALVGVV